jgi:hypothetical protein
VKALNSNFEKGGDDVIEVGKFSAFERERRSVKIERDSGTTSPGERRAATHE